VLLFGLQSHIVGSLTFVRGLDPLLFRTFQSVFLVFYLAVDISLVCEATPVFRPEKS
jgi:hypothetical protein